MIKIIFFDIDGTLRGNNETGIRPSVYRAIDKARKVGVRCFVATGRHPLEIEEENLLDELQFDGYVYLNGNYCVDGDGCLLHHLPFDPSQLRILLDQKKTEQFSLLLMEKDCMYIDSTSDHVEKMQASINTRVPPLQPDIEASIGKEIYQMILFADDATLERVTAKLPLCHPTWWSEDGGAMDVDNEGLAWAVDYILAQNEK